MAPRSRSSAARPRLLLRADDDERQPDRLRGLERRELVLARLDRADREHVVACAAVAGPEHGSTPFGVTTTAVGREPVQLDEIAARALRHREHTRGAAGRARHDPPEHEAVAATHQRRVALEREIVDRDDRRARAAQRQRVLRVHEGGPEPSEQPRERPRHAQLLARGRELDRLDRRRGRDPGRRVTAAIRRPAPAAGSGQLAQQVEDVGLVAGALAAEDVGVDDDERLGHASSRHSASTASAARAQVNACARSQPEAAQLVAARLGLGDAGRDRRGVERIDEHGGAAGDLLRRAPAGRHDGRPAGHRLEHREPEALVERREDEAARTAVERRELLVGDAARPARHVDAAPAACPDDAQLDARAAGPPRRRAPGSCAARASPPRARSRRSPQGRPA